MGSVVRMMEQRCPSDEMKAAEVAKPADWVRPTAFRYHNLAAMGTGSVDAGPNSH